VKEKIMYLKKIVLMLSVIGLGGGMLSAQSMTDK
jgi:hypothetical protein